MCRLQDTMASNPAGSSVPVWTSDPFAQYGFSAGNFGDASMSLQSFCYGNMNSSVPAVENISAFEDQNDGFLSFERYTAKSGRKKGRFIGVRQRVTGKWVAEIRDRDKKTRLWLGSFNSAEEAAIAYDIEARRIRGAKAKLNFPDGIPDLRLLLRARQTCIRTRRRCRRSSIKKPKKEESSVEEAMASEECSSPDSSVTEGSQEAVLKEENEEGSVENSVEELWRDPFEEEDVVSHILGLTEEPSVEAISDFQIWDFEDIPFPPNNFFHCPLLPCSEVLYM